MCLGKAYFETGDKRELVMDSIASVKIDDGRLSLSNIFGDRKELQAQIREIDFEGSRIILTGTAAGRE